MRLVAIIIGVLGLSAPALSQGDLRGHGGAVRALAISPSGTMAISGSFDQSAIVWSLAQGRAVSILRAHEGAVNAVLALRDGFVTAGEDGRIAIWSAGNLDQPLSITRVHDAPVAGLALSPDGVQIASAGWDGGISLRTISGDGAARRFEGHAGMVNAVAFMPDGKALVSGGYDASVRIWPIHGAAPHVIRLASPVSSLVVTKNGLIGAGCADGTIVFIDSTGHITGSVAATETPVTALASNPEGNAFAAGSPRGAVALVDAISRKVKFTLNGPGLPVWSIAFTPDSKHILTGGADHIVRRWNADTGEHIGAIAGAGADDELDAFAHMPGAEVFKACAVCHTLRPDSAGRAGPSLHGVFGRKAGTLPGYNYSAAFRRLDLVWSGETISRLFELGPQTYTPGTKMPEQTLGNARERQALIDFLRAATAPK